MRKERNIDTWLRNYLIEEHALPNHKIREIESDARERKVPFHDAVVEGGIMTEVELFKHAQAVLTYESMFLEDFVIDRNDKTVSKRTLEKNNAVIISKDLEKKQIIVGMSNPSNLNALDEIRRESKMQVKGVFVINNQIRYAMNASDTDLNELLDGVLVNPYEIDNVNNNEKEEENALKEDDSVVTKLINSILQEAISDRASDVHIEPLERSVRVRFRIDGILIVKVENLDRSLAPQLISRIKVLANMDIAESRRPQDGSFRMRDQKGNHVDFRASSMSTHYGEKIVLRITTRTTTKLGMNTIGFNQEERDMVLEVLQRPYGLILLTGPTGSGKTTSLYGMLGHLNTPERNIITIEDPIERDIEGVNQTSVNARADITFSSGLKTSLRQDPDIIMLGEIRDEETASTSIQAALTGHLVLSTLHTNDSTGAVTRLRDMGVDDYKIPSAVLCVIAQRLLRKNCEHCSEEYTPAIEEIHMIQQFAPELDLKEGFTCKRGKGCKHCNNTGFSGRMPVFEIFIMSEEIKEDILENKNSSEIRKKAIANGMKTMQRNGVEKIMEGLTTVEELRRVIFVM